MSAAYRLLAATAAASALVAGCAHSPVGPDYAAPASLSAAQAASAATFQSAGGYAAETTLPPHWWRLYNDRQLEALVTQALEHNTDLRQAVDLKPDAIGVNSRDLETFQMDSVTAESMKPHVLTTTTSAAS